MMGDVEMNMGFDLVVTNGIIVCYKLLDWSSLLCVVFVLSKRRYWTGNDLRLGSLG
jgi:hypothetical protein